MSGKYFEFKIKVSDEEEAKNKLKTIIFGEPKIRDVLDTYLVSDSGVAEKIYEANNKIFHTTVKKTADGFMMESNLISEEEKVRLLSTHKIDKAMKKQRTIWEVDGMQIAIDDVENLGIFIELQGRDKQKLLEFIKSLGFSPEQFILQPYNKLI